MTERPDPLDSPTKQLFDRLIFAMVAWTGITFVACAVGCVVVGSVWVVGRVFAWW